MISKDKIKRLISSNNLKNSYWIIGERIIQMVIGLIVGIISARYLGPSNYGTLNYTAAFISFFSLLTALGMEGVVMVKLIENPSREGVYLGSAILYRVIAAVFSTVAITFLMIILNPSDPLKLTIVLLQSWQLLFKAFDIFDVWFQRHLQSKYVSTGKMLACIVVAVYKIYLLVESKGLVWFAISNSLSDFVVAAVLVFFYWRQHGQALKFSIKTGNEIIAESYHFILTDVMSAIYTYMDRIMIGKLLTDTDVGYYTTAIAICGMWSFIPMAIIRSFRPTIMELKEKADDLYLLRLEQLFSAVIWICISFAFLINVIARYAIVLLYGPAYSGAIGPLRILCWAQAFGVISVTRSIWILAEHKNQYTKKYVFVGTIVNLVLNALLIPLAGIKGAAYATLFTEVTVCVIAPAFFRETRDISRIIVRSLVFKWNKND